LKAPFVSDEKRLYAGLDTPQLDYTFNASAQDTGVWKYVTATMTSSWNTTGLLMNANNTLTTTTGTEVSTWKSFALIADGALEVGVTLNITNTILANQVFEAGLFPFGAGTAAPTEGVYFRLTTTGLIGVTNYNGTETTTSVLMSAAAFSLNTNYQFKILIGERAVSFWMNGSLMANGILNTAGANGQPFITTALPLSFQTRNSGAVVGTPMQVKITDCYVDQKSVPLNKPYPHIQALKGLQGYQGTNGGTMGTTALYTNSLAAGAGAAMTNTAASLGTGLGGQFSAQPTLAAGTDGIVCSYQVPAGGVNQVPRSLVITGVKIQGAITTTLAGGPTILYAYSLAYGHSAVSMATAEAVAAKAPRRIAIGYESFATGGTAVKLSSPAGVSMQFMSPIVVNPGEFVAIVAKNVGAVTTAGVITFLVTFDCYWE